MEKNLVLQIIMQANDKASKQLEYVKTATSGLNGKLTNTKQALKELEQQQKSLNQFKANGEQIREIAAS